MDPNFKRFLKELTTKLPETLDKDGIQYNIYSNRIAFSCPIHGSNKHESASVFTEESQRGLIGNWVCFTHGCETEIGKSVYSLLKEYFKISKNWTDQQAKQYVASLVDIERVEYNASNYEFVNQVKIFQKPVISYNTQFDRSVLQKLETPSKYYQQRNFSAEILKKFEVGDCNDKTAKFRYRSIIPVFTPENDKVVNFIARSIYDKCSLCDTYHEPTKFCPVTDLQKYYASKWLNFSNLGSTFYNLWNAKEAIQSTNSCILVESASDIWRLEECGLHNSLALLTNNISYQQQNILQTLPITTIYLCLDNDDAGRSGIKNILEKLSRMYTMKIFVPHKKDLSDMTTKEVKELFNICN